LQEFKTLQSQLCHHLRTDLEDEPFAQSSTIEDDLAVTNGTKG